MEELLGDEGFVHVENWTKQPEKIITYCLTGGLKIVGFATLERCADGSLLLRAYGVDLLYRCVCLDLMTGQILMIVLLFWLVHHRMLT